MHHGPHLYVLHSSKSYGSGKNVFLPPKVIYYQIVRHQMWLGILDIERFPFCQVELVSTCYQNLFSPFQVQILIQAAL